MTSTANEPNLFPLIAKDYNRDKRISINIHTYEPVPSALKQRNKKCLHNTLKCSVEKHLHNKWRLEKHFVGYKIWKHVFIHTESPLLINPWWFFVSLVLYTGDAFMLVYTIDNKETFQEVLRLRQHIIDTKRAKGIKSTPMVLAGNKVDRDDFREIDFDDARRAVSSAKRCSCLEVSAKDNVNIDCLFHSLFEHARLPSEMTPSLHRKLGGTESNGPPDLSPKTNPRGITLRKRISDACGVISPNARRPSLRSDLLQVRNNALRSVKRGDVDEEEEQPPEGTSFRKKRGCILQWRRVNRTSLCPFLSAYIYHRMRASFVSFQNFASCSCQRIFQDVCQDVLHNLTNCYFYIFSTYWW